MQWRRLVAGLLLALAACAQPRHVTPALWQVDGPKGERAWLFGTIHALPEQVDWRSPKLDAALAASDRIVVEVAAINDPAELGRIFATLSRTPGQPLLGQRLPSNLRPALASLLKQEGIPEAAFAETETWAAALALAQALQDEGNSSNGIDKALLKAARGKRVEEFEGAEAQLGIFDGLPEAQQRVLLAATVAGAASAEAAARRLANAWGRGDMALIAAETDKGFMADPTLRAALLSDRNLAWDRKLEALLTGGARPFVAVGAAHLAGQDGLPALLTAHGWKVTRLQ